MISIKTMPIPWGTAFIMASQCPSLRRSMLRDQLHRYRSPTCHTFQQPLTLGTISPRPSSQVWEFVAQHGSGLVPTWRVGFLNWFSSTPCRFSTAVPQGSVLFLYTQIGAEGFSSVPALSVRSYCEWVLIPSYNRASDSFIPSYTPASAQVSAYPAGICTSEKLNCYSSLEKHPYIVIL